MGLILDFDNFVEALVKIGQTLVNSENLDTRLEKLCSSETFKNFVFSCTKIPFEVDSEAVRLPKASRLDALPVLRKIRTRFSQPIKFLAADMAELAHIFSLSERSVLENFLKSYLLPKQDQIGCLNGYSPEFLEKRSCAIETI